VRVRPAAITVIMLAAVVLGIVAGSRLFSLFTGG
jgi:hypothetical protein